MHLLLDNCVLWRLAASIRQHEVSTVIDFGWADLKDNQLLDRMTGHFDVPVRVD